MRALCEVHPTIHLSTAVAATPPTIDAAAVAAAAVAVTHVTHRIVRALHTYLHASEPRRGHRKDLRLNAAARNTLCGKIGELMR